MKNWVFLQKTKSAVSLILLGLFWALPYQLQGQTPPELFQTGITFYNAEKYYDAQQIFQQLSSLSSNNRLYSVSQFMLIKIAYRLGDWEKCRQLANNFLGEHPNSRYTYDVKYLLAELALAQEQYSAAFQQYLLLLPIANEPQLDKIDDALTLLANNFSALSDLRSARDATNNDLVSKYLTIRLAERYHLDGDTKQATRELQSLSGLLQPSFLRKCYNSVEAKLKKPPLPPQYIGVILPLSGANATIGQKILNGLKFALIQHRQKYGNTIGAIVIDNRSEIALTVKAAETLAQNPRVIALFGPISSEEATVMALIANRYRLPMITPTASSSQLTTLSPYVFQANLDYENTGRFLALYSIQVSKVKTIASISPVDEFGKDVTDAFCRTVDEFGGQVISQQWYLTEPVDLKHQINAIRQVATDHLQAEINRSMQAAHARLIKLVQTDRRFANDTVRFVVGNEYCYIFKKDTTIRLKMKEALIYTGLMHPEDFEIPKRDTIIFSPKLINGFLLPSRAADVNLILPQLTYYDIKVPIFASANWNDPHLLKSYKTIQQNLRFISDYYFDTESRTYKNFVANYKAAFKSEPGRFELYGYDTMKAILQQMEGKRLDRNTLYQSLLNMPVYHGIARNISFSGNRPRVNSCAFIMGYGGTRFVPVATIENGRLIDKSIP